MTRPSIVISLILIFLSGTPAVMSATLFVAPLGDDTHPGTMEKPLASLDAAKAKVRQLKLDAKEPITVYLREGTYYLPTTLSFGPDDSGTPAVPVTYAAYTNEKVVISGGTRLTPSWVPDQNGIVKAQIDTCQFDQLFVNGKRQILARWPNHQLDPQGVDVGYAKGLQKSARPLRQLVYDPATFSSRKWARPNEAILHCFQNYSWGNMQWQIRDIDAETHTLELGAGGWQMGTLWFAKPANGVGPDSLFFIENVKEELDAPGEWYYGRNSHELYYLPAAGTDLTHAVFETAGRLKELVVFTGKSHAGTMTQPVRNLHLRGLTFRHTARTFLEPYETRLRGDWAIARLGAVRFDGAEDCSVENCRFDSVGGNGVFISNYGKRIAVQCCYFSETGDSAICLVGSDDAVRGLGMHKVTFATHEGIDTTPGPLSQNFPAECQISGNLIHDLGIFGKQTAGVYLSATEKITVSHNTICRTPRAGICINDGCWGGHTIAFNDIFQTVRETGDHGPFNSWGRDRYWQSAHREGLPCDMSRSKALSRVDSRTPTIIQNNRFVHEPSNHSWGIDLDDGSSNYILRDNLCLGCGVKLREGYYRTVENNIIISPYAPAKQCCFSDSQDVINKNIFVDLSANFGWKDMADRPIKMDNNLYFNFKGAPPVFTCRSASLKKGLKNQMTLAEWQAQGLDVHAVYADPEFTAPERGDFSVRPGSPALKLGFKNFPMDQFGVQLPEYRAIVERIPRKFRLIDRRLQ